MKKIIFLFMFIFLFSSHVKAETFRLGEKVLNMYVTSSDGTRIHNGAPFILERNSDGAFVYCLNPFDRMSEGGNYKETIASDIDKEILNKINLIAYYGYKYKNHTDIKWYGVTQALIWKALGLDVYFTDSYYGNKVIKYTEEIKEIESLVNEHYKTPDFGITTFEVGKNTSSIFIDKNNVLENYNITTNLDYEVNNNKLKLNFNNNTGLYSVDFTKPSLDYDNIIYTLDGYQSLISPGKFRSSDYKININVLSGSIYLNLYDFEYKNRKYASLSGSEFGVYKDSKLIKKVTMEDNHSILFDDLDLGEYEIKQLKSGVGYIKDDNIYKITLTNKAFNQTLDIFNKIINQDIYINKYYGEKNNYQLEDDVSFGLYDMEDNLLRNLFLKDGTIKINLEYGYYKLKQLTTKEGYKKVDDYYIKVEENVCKVIDLYDEKIEKEKLIVEVPDTYKKSYNNIIGKIFIMLGFVLIIIYKRKICHNS